MFGHFGFSYVGCIYLLMLFIPNILWAKYKPTGYDDVVSNENKVLLALERIGQVLVTFVAGAFNDYNLKPFSLWGVYG